MKKKVFQDGSVFDFHVSYMMFNVHKWHIILKLLNCSQGNTKILKLSKWSLNI